MSTGTPRRNTRTPRRLRRLVARALAQAQGPERVHEYVLDDGTVVVSVEPMYVWRSRLPNGHPVGFITATPVLEYSDLVDGLAQMVHGGCAGWMAIEHTPACRALGVGCTCIPTVVRRVVWAER